MFRALLPQARTTLDDNGGIFQSIRFWQGWALLATVAALFTFAANIEVSVGGYTPDYVAVVGDEAAPLWVVHADLNEGSMKVRAAAAKAPVEGEQYVLWIADAQNPQRLGALPVGEARHSLKLTGTTAALLGHRKTLAVSREAVGADQDGPPTDWYQQASLAKL